MVDAKCCNLGHTNLGNEKINPHHGHKPAVNQRLIFFNIELAKYQKKPLRNPKFFFKDL
jgi:hypothetical protein